MGRRNITTAIISVIDGVFQNPTSGLKQMLADEDNPNSPQNRYKTAVFYRNIYFIMLLGTGMAGIIYFLKMKSNKKKKELCNETTYN